MNKLFTADHKRYFIRTFVLTAFYFSLKQPDEFKVYCFAVLLLLSEHKSEAKIKLVSEKFDSNL